MAGKEYATRIKEAFADKLHEGMTQRKAYKATHPDTIATDKSIDEMGSRWEKDVKVQARLAELRAKDTKKTIATVEDGQKELTSIAYNEELPEAVRLKALDMLLKSLGGYTERHEISGNISLTQRIEHSKEAVLAYLKEVNGE